MQIIPLPSPLTATRYSALEKGLFPLDLLLDIQDTQQATLRSIVLTMPVHVHGPIAHLGMIHSDEPGQTVNANELIHCLRANFGEGMNMQV